jgi:hypothetical protein
VGAHSKRATINGTTVTSSGGIVEFGEGGLLTSGNTNIGTYEDSRARFIPSFRVGAGVNLTPQWTAKIGYNLIVWGGVTRAGSTLPPNLAIDPRNIPGLSSAPGTPGPAPVFPGLGGSELIAHGLDLGLEYRY